MHGGEIFHIAKSLQRPVSSLIDFSANINPLGLHEAVREAIREGTDEVIHYPSEDCRFLRSLLAKQQGVKVETIRIGNGAGELFFRIVRALSSPIRALLSPPCFSEYERALRSIAGTEIRYYKRGDDLEIGEDFLEELEGINIVFLCTPENPTGFLLKKELMYKILRRCSEKGIYLVIDESFMDFVDEGAYSFVSETASHRRLIVVRSFTKRFALPGLRIGALYCSDRRLLERMDEATPSWMVNHLAQQAAMRALMLPLRDEALFDLLRRERAFLTGELENLLYRVFPGRANFLLLKDISPVPRRVCEGLLKRGMLIRDCSDFYGLADGYFRIAVRTPKENRALIGAWKEVLAECSVL